MKLIVAICGASGVSYGIELLKALKEAGVETHLVLSEWAEKLVEEETTASVGEVKKLASKVYGYREMGAAISSSSFLVDGMVVCPAFWKFDFKNSRQHAENKETASCLCKGNSLERPMFRESGENITVWWNCNASKPWLLPQTKKH